MTAHIHVWTADRSRSKFTCECGVQGYSHKIIPGQMRTARSGVVPYACRYRFTDRSYHAYPFVTQGVNHDVGA